MFVQPSGKSKHTRSILECSVFRHRFSYTDNHVTEAEFGFLPQRIQEQMKRAAVNNLATAQPQSGAGSWYHHPAPPSRYKRVGAFHFIYMHFFFFHIFARLAEGTNLFRGIAER